MTGYLRIPYKDRPFTHPLAQQLASLMEKKRSNICLAADVKSMGELLRIADLVGPYIVMLKTHVDTYDDFSEKKLHALKALAKKHHFVIFEDRKFMDIGNTVEMQYTGGIFKISKWAPLVNAAIIPGTGILDALRKGINQTAKVVSKAAHNAVLLLAEMSSEGNVFPLFLDKTIQSARLNRDIVIGFIAQRSFGDPSFLYMTPGVNAIHKGDDLGQTYRTPEQVIKQSGSDILIIGRGIYAPEQGQPPETAAKAYQEAGWKAHEAALGTTIRFEQTTSRSL